VVELTEESITAGETAGRVRVVDGLGIGDRSTWCCATGPAGQRRDACRDCGIDPRHRILRTGPDLSRELIEPELSEELMPRRARLWRPRFGGPDGA